MDSKTWSLVKEYPIDGAFDISENSTHFIVRSNRDIYSIRKKTLEITNSVHLELDNEFGYKFIETNEDVNIIVVYPDKDPGGDELMGNPKAAYLNAYSGSELLWVYKLKKWSITTNYGGFYLIDNYVVFTDVLSNKLCTIILNAKDGNIVKTIDARRYKDQSRIPLGPKQSLKDNESIYLSEIENGIYRLQLKDGVIAPKQMLPSFDPKTIAQNDDYIYCHGWIGNETLLIILDKKANSIYKKISLPDGIDIESIVASSNNDKVLFIHEKYHLSCFDLANSKVIWSLANESNSKIFQVIMDGYKQAYILWKKPDSAIQLLNLESGEIVQEIKPTGKRFYEPLFVFGDHLFISEFNKLNCYKRD